MNILPNILLISLFILSCEINYHKSDNKLSDEQKEYAQNIIQQSGIRKSHWKNEKILQVTIEPGFLRKSDSNNDNNRAIEIYAEMLAEDGFEYIGLETCIEIVNTSEETLSYTCYP